MTDKKKSVDKELIRELADLLNETGLSEIEVEHDDIRIRVARAVYGYPALQRYGFGARPPIRIIVKNGDVSLEGVVANEFDRNVAFLQANGVSGVFQVTNNLRIDGNG